VDWPNQLPVNFFNNPQIPQNSLRGPPVSLRVLLAKVPIFIYQVGIFYINFAEKRVFMPSFKPASKLPKIEGFERIKYQDLAISGLPARVYSAYFGRPKRIIDAFKILYCRGKDRPSNTGRISMATTKLIEANYVDLYKIERSNWPLLCANLQPLYGLFIKKKIRTNEEDRKWLEKALIPNFEASERFGITEEEAIGSIEFVPSLMKITAHLNSAISMALLSLAKAQQPDFKEERELLRRIKARTVGNEETGVLEMDISSVNAFADDLTLKTRVAIKGGEDPTNILFFKLVRLLHEKEHADKIEEDVFTLFE
jgi:hypothetical protein